MTYNLNDVIAKRYRLVGAIGEGGMQHVYRADDLLLKRSVALKMPKNSSALKRFERSAQVSAKVNNRHVAKTLDYISDNEINCLIEELVVGRDLSQLLKKFPQGLDPYLVSKAMHQIAIGIACSHAAGVVHRDLKPSNIMVEGGLAFNNFKVTDFGIAKMAEAELDEAVAGGENSITASQTAVGAMPYMAPEMIQSVKKASFPADVWSLGAMVYELLSGKKPFGAGLMAVPKILLAQYEASIPQIGKVQFSPLGQQLLGIVIRCLQVDADARPTAEEIVTLCGDLCYTAINRRTGVVSSFRYSAWGFINTDDDSVFFHKDSIYGQDALAIGDHTSFADYKGEGANRAFPVLRMLPSDA